MSQYAKDQPAGFTNRIEKIAIVGAGGRIGKHIVEHLLKTGKHTVTALTRPDSTNTFPSGVHSIPVNYDDPSTIVAALRGQQFLIISLSVFSPPDTHSKLVQAAAQAGIRYVMPNYYGSDMQNAALNAASPLAAIGQAARDEIEKLGMAWVALVCGFWYEFSLGGGPWRFGFHFGERRFEMVEDGYDVKQCTSTWPQCGRAVAALLSLKEMPEDEKDGAPTLAQFRNKPVYISSFRVSQREMFESVKRVTGTTDADWTIAKEMSAKRYQDGQELFKKGVRAGMGKMMYTRLFFPSGDGDYEKDHGLHNELLGLPKEDLDEWTKEGVRMAENNEVPF